MCFMKIFRSVEAIQENHRLPKINHKCPPHSCTGSAPTSPCHPSHSSQLAFNLFEQRCIECAFGLHFTFLIIWRCVMKIQEELKIHGACSDSLCHMCVCVIIDTKSNSKGKCIGSHDWKVRRYLWLQARLDLAAQTVPPIIWLLSIFLLFHLQFGFILGLPVLFSLPHPWNQGLSLGSQNESLSPFLHTHTCNLINSMEERKEFLSSRNYSKGFLPFQWILLHKWPLPEAILWPEETTEWLA